MVNLAHERINEIGGSSTMTTATVAVIYVPPGEFDTYALDCSLECERKGYDMYGITPDWAEAVQLKESGEVDCIVVGSSDHIDPHNLPGVEVAGEAADHDAVDERRGRSRRRPRIV
jgi:hypothetical protein